MTRRSAETGGCEREQRARAPHCINDRGPTVDINGDGGDICAACIGNAISLSITEGNAVDDV